MDSTEGAGSVILDTSTHSGRKSQKGSDAIDSNGSQPGDASEPPGQLVQQGEVQTRGRRWSSIIEKTTIDGQVKKAKLSLKGNTMKALQADLEDRGTGVGVIWRLVCLHWSERGVGTRR